MTICCFFSVNALFNQYLICAGITSLFLSSPPLKQFGSAMTVSVNKQNHFGRRKCTWLRRCVHSLSVHCWSFVLNPDMPHDGNTSILTYFWSWPTYIRSEWTKLLRQLTHIHCNAGRATPHDWRFVESRKGLLWKMVGGDTEKTCGPQWLGPPVQSPVSAWVFNDQNSSLSERHFPFWTAKYTFLCQC